MKVARYYTFELEFLKPAKLPNWKGNLIRGAFGNHLKKLFCMNDLKDCHRCSLLFKCPYGYLFRTTTKGIVLRKTKHYTKPYVIKPPLESKTTYKRGETIKFSLVLFGDAMEFESHVISAVNSMCKFGLGTRDCRGQLKLKRAFVENPLKNEKEFLFEDGELFSPRLFIRSGDLKIDVGRIFRVKFLTPFRLLRDGAVIAEPSFRDLLPFMLRKYSSIAYQYLKREIDVDVEEVLKLAENVATISANLSKRTFVYRGKEEIFIHGEITYSGRLKADARKVLGFCELSHVGKRTSYGHGWYKIEN
jgi:CRISPR/Cas system endoribonuclease Cas6 (RAMP superfamily)